MKKESMRSERSDLCYLVSVAIKTTYDTRSLYGVERCVDALNQLKYLSLSAMDIRFSKSIFKLEILRNHRNPKIRKEAHELFDLWIGKLYAHGKDNSLNAGPNKNKISLKPKKHVLTRGSELKIKDERRCLLTTHERGEIKKETTRARKTRETKTMKKEIKTDFVESRKKEEQRSLSRKDEGEERDTKPANLKRGGDAWEAVMMKKPCLGEVKVPGNQNKDSTSGTTTDLAQHLRRNIKDKDGRVTTKTLIPPPRRVNAWKNVPLRPVYA